MTTTTESAALLLESGLIDEVRAKAGEQRAEDRAAELLKLAEINRRESEELPPMAAELLAAVTRRQELDREIEAANIAIRKIAGPLNELQFNLDWQRTKAENRIRQLADPRIHQAIKHIEEMRGRVRARFGTGNEKVIGFAGVRLVPTSNGATCDAADEALVEARHKLEALLLEVIPDGLEQPMRDIWKPVIAALKPLQLSPDLKFLAPAPAPASDWVNRIFNAVKGNLT
jgi:hypothetical protein